MLYLGEEPHVEIEYYLGNNQLDSQNREYRKRFQVVPNKG